MVCVFAHRSHIRSLPQIKAWPKVMNIITSGHAVKPADSTE
eukprot:COSAG05_NODE_17742_length_320_cov_0.624434_2_plen_40_part_01